MLKIAGLTIIGFSFEHYGLVMLCMIPAAIIGTRAGARLLSNINEHYFRLAFRAVLVVPALKLIVYDGLVHLLT